MRSVSATVPAPKWLDRGRKERRTFHANGDGTFTADGESFSLRRLMEDKFPPGV